MKRVAALLALWVATFMPVDVYSQEGQATAGVQVVIDDIKCGDSITGHVTGLSSDLVPRSHVVIYVLTDVWHIHPFARGPEGLSWAKIDTNGKWRINTVKPNFERQVPAEQFAALVIDASTSAPPRSEVIPRNITKSIKQLLGTSDYGCM
jgi:hypothetical protein